MWYAITATDDWESLVASYDDFGCWPDTGCFPGEKLDLDKVWRIDFAISNKTGDTPGKGLVTIDSVQGIK
jgi:hypothetical protein